MNQKKFEISKHSTIDKSFEIIPPDDMDIYITVDFDDVNHTKVNREAKWIIRTLNQALGITSP